MKEKGMSKGEFNSVASVNGGLENMINWDGKVGFKIYGIFFRDRW